MKPTERHLKRLHHKYAHNRRYFELKCRLWNFFRKRVSEETTVYILDRLDGNPELIKEAIKSMDLPEGNKRTLCQYIDWIVELDGIVI